MTHTDGTRMRAGASTQDYRAALDGEGEFGSLGYEWSDKPHRLIYDLCGEIDAQSAEITRLRSELASKEKMGADVVAWAVERWNAEVKHRPLRNIHRGSLDDTWRQVMRRYGGNPEALCGPAHDELVAANPSAAVRSPDHARDLTIEECARVADDEAKECRVYRDQFSIALELEAVAARIRSLKSSPPDNGGGE